MTRCAQAVGAGMVAVHLQLHFPDFLPNVAEVQP